MSAFDWRYAKIRSILNQPIELKIKLGRSSQQSALPHFVGNWTSFNTDRYLSEPVLSLPDIRPPLVQNFFCYESKPGSPLQLDRINFQTPCTAGELKWRSEEGLRTIERLQNHLVAEEFLPSKLPSDPQLAKRFFAEVKELYNTMENLSQMTSLLKESPHPEMQELATAYNQRVSDLWSAVDVSHPLYERVASLPLGFFNPQDQGLITYWIAEGKKYGASVPSQADRDAIARWEQENKRVQDEYEELYKKEFPLVQVKLADLAGVDPDYIQALRERSQKENRSQDPQVLIFRINNEDLENFRTVKKPEVLDLILDAMDSTSTSQKDQLLTTHLENRHKILKKKDFPSNATVADFDAAQGTIGSGKDIGRFILDFWEAIQPLAAWDRKLLLERKKEDCKNKGYTADELAQITTLTQGEEIYYTELIRRERYQDKRHELGLSAQSLGKGTDKTFADRLRSRKPRYEYINTLVWAPGVEARVEYMRASAEPGAPEIPLGGTFLDLLKRDGKYSADYMKALVSNRFNAQTSPVTALHFNLTPGQKVPYDQIKARFHEEWHGKEFEFGKGKKASESDTFEVLSQMVEDWVDDPKETLQRNFGVKVSPEMVRNAKRSARIGEGIRMQRELFLAYLDYLIHNSPDGKVDLRAAELEAAKVFGLEAELFRKNPDVLDHQDPSGRLRPVHNFYPYAFDSSRYYKYWWTLPMAAAITEKFNGDSRDEQTLEHLIQMYEKVGEQPFMARLGEFLGRPYSYPDGIAAYVRLWRGREK